MDEQPVIQPSQKDAFLAFLSKNKRIITIVLAIIVLIPICIIIYTKYTNNVKSPTKINQQSSTPTPTFIPIDLSKPSKDLTTKDGTTFFVGEVVERTKTSLTIKGVEKSIKFAVSDQLYFIEVPKVLTEPLKDYLAKKTIFVDYNYIKQGDHISATIKTTGQSQVVTGGLFFR